jgi:15-cis-phytoene synthase
MSPDEYCQQKAVQSGSSFYYSFLFLPSERRRAITALYAFCREVDDIVDECNDPSIAATKLAWWRKELAALYTGAPTHPVTQALQPFVGPFNLTQSRLNEIIDGMQMDLEQTRYLDYAGLRLYCHRVAGVVGLLAAEIFGRTDEQTLAYADNLGLALQLTNIIRDVGEDARKGRIYLPIEDLQKFNVTAAQILKFEKTPQFIELMRFQVQRAREQYRKAYALLPEQDRKAQRAGLIMSSIYSQLLGEIERGQFSVLSHRTSLTPIRKLWVAYKTWVSGRPAPV